ncbi:hypothetical protein ACLM5J_06095 [Nocardioides sp. Bht2]|uniref:hypothetical protein n=1 Tax=Nocardioides sp. Bht2 TaxID=3392297 RepID=UPI0039B42266
MSALSRIAVVCVGLVLGTGAFVGCSTDDDPPTTGSVDAPSAPESPKAATELTAVAR